MSSNPTPEQPRELVTNLTAAGVDVHGMPHKCCDEWPECSHVYYAVQARQGGLAERARLVAERDEARRRSQRRWEEVQAACERAEMAYRARDDAAAQVAALREALAEIAHYEEPWPQDPSDVYEEFQDIARAALAGVPAADPAPPPPEGASDKEPGEACRPSAEHAPDGRTEP